MEEKPVNGNGNFEQGETPQQKEDQEPLELTERDISVFQLIHEQRYLVYNQIQRAFWPERSLSAKACYKRVTRLEKAEYLGAIRSESEGVNVYFLMDKAYEEIRKRGLDHGLRPYRFTEKSEYYVSHDLKVATVRIVFHELGLKQWTSERLLKERDHLTRYPDGVLHLGRYKAAIEVENVPKEKGRYSDLFRHYAQADEYFLVFVVMCKGIRDWLITSSDYNPQQVWFTKYGEVVNKGGEAYFRNGRDGFALQRFL